MEHTRPAKYDHDEGYEYGNLPQGLSEIKNQMESMIRERNRINDWIRRLKRVAEGKSFEMISELEQLYRAFNVPTVHRLRRMGALDPVEHPSVYEPVRAGTGSLKPVKSQVTNGEHQPGNGKQSSRLKISSKRRKFFKYTFDWKSLIQSRHFPTEDTSSSLSEPLLVHSDSRESTPHIWNDGAQLTYEPLTPAQVDRKNSISTVLEDHFAKRRISLGDLKIPDDIMPQRDGDEYEEGKGLTIPQKIDTWNKLQKKVLEFTSSETVPNAKEAQLQREFLVPFYLLGDHIARYGLLPSLRNVDSFNPETTIKMVELHTQLLFRQFGGGFYATPASVIPELEFWESGATVEHFHRSIKALPTKDKEQVVHGVIRTILSRTPEKFSPEASPSKRFEQLCEEFQRAEFLQEVRSLSSALSDGQAVDQLKTSNHLRLVTFVQDLRSFFEEPEMKTEEKQRRAEFQLVYYMIDFLDKFHHPIIEKVGKRPEHQQTLAQVDTNDYTFRDQLTFMRVYLKTWRNTFRDHSYTGTATWDDMQPFVAILRGQGGNYGSLGRWIHECTTKIFSHRGRSDKNGFEHGLFDSWMGRRYP
ncbi:hypothetical protein PSTG_04812 [Puccinia striiformis f. sp. tritici PST-78]|uniref:Uncharacterized protein n=2 Tax=Puccinia striiformis f. sp. tritici TaxID=168172 RepID=A0A0L0VRU1_9BASI|nr:hypothetical protein PSTG_04812 [Puccinia striiformis f. sp. tritici PST-78]